MSFKIDQNTVKANVLALQGFMQEHEMDAFVVTSFDPYLNEYVPMENCHRYFVTAFSGSTAEAIVPQTGRVKLFIDGRYHEQADLEVDSNIVEVVKAQGSATQALIDDVATGNYQTIGFEADRIPLGYVKKFEKHSKMLALDNQELRGLMDFPAPKALPEVKYIAREHRGSDTLEKLNKVITDEKSGYFITAIDSLAWITNCRGYHLPNLSSFLGRALVTYDQVFVFVAPDVPVSDEAKNAAGLSFIFAKDSEILSKLKELQAKYALTHLNYDPEMLNELDFRMLQQAFGDKSLVSKAGGLVEFHSIKEPLEIEEMQRGFARADKAIFNTIKWVKEQVAAGNKISELDLYNETTKKYQEQGSVEQSFGTIAGVGPNGSIIHYGDPKADVIIKKNDMVLLDSGGYFAGGFATDTTRTFLASSEDVNPEYKRMYTLVLKGVLQAQNAVFPAGISGASIDGLCRAPLFRTGQNYQHGTGHGVGIHVHEGGVRLSHVSNLPMKEGQVVSIEPGLYIPGLAGVRIENIALVEKHPEFEGFLRFRSLVYIGYEPGLIDEQLLTHEELEWLDAYEQECVKRGTSFQEA